MSQYRCRRRDAGELCLEVIGPIQMGLNKPIHFTDAESTVHEIVDVTAIAVIDAIVESKKQEL